MNQWFEWVLGSICGLLAVLQFLAVIWCQVALRRKWRTTPEFWTIDWLGIVARIEREFGVALTVADFEDLSTRARIDLTAGQLWELVAGRLRARGSAVPRSGWARLVDELAAALNVKPWKIGIGSRLYADLGMGED
jgi:hypothetical protein